ASNEDKPEVTPHVVVIGAGPGGLSLAMLLARAGARVTVLERQPHVGGRSATLERDGYRFDVGPTFFLYPQVLQEIFAACGRELSDEVELRRLDTLYRLVFEEDGDFRVHADKDALTAEMARLSPEDAARLPALFADNRAKLDRFKPILEMPFTRLHDLVSPNMLKALPRFRPWRSLDRDLSAHLQDPRLRLAFSFQSKYLGMSPFKCPSLFTILSFLEHEYGVFHPIGGCGAIIEAMARVARDLGVDIRTGEEVQELAFVNRRPVAAVTASGHHACDALVVNADFSNAMTRLVPDGLRRRWRDRRIAKKRFSCSTFMLYLGIEGTVDFDHHTIFLCRDYERFLAGIESGRHLPETPCLYVQNACVTDPGQAPPGHSTIYALAPVPHLGPHVDWSRDKNEFRERVLDRLEAMGIANLRERIRVEKMVTPDDWQHDFQLYKGATFNLAHNLGQMLYWRPRNRFEDLDGVYLVGGGTHPGSGLPVIFEGARITARLLAEDLGLRTADWSEAARETSLGSLTPVPHAEAA
ncbi:MAG: phytoene desaturase family protein, partial [Geminicoccaceae bacterium]|nr:phytoene desaturase family protein [Geminicoccaceae bacterium]